jgi:hypothetical protein
MSVLIIIYDQTITKRQEKTMKTALRSGALIASLFPVNVRNRLMEDIDENEERQKRKSRDEDENDTSQKAGKQRSRPIADFFPSTTIMCKYQKMRKP